jgi:hypothetical protein
MQEQAESTKSMEPSNISNVFVVTSGQLVLATFDNHSAAVAYCERDDVGGKYGLWMDARHTYSVTIGLNVDGVYRIWNQTVYRAAHTKNDED